MVSACPSLYLEQKQVDGERLPILVLEQKQTAVKTFFYIYWIRDVFFTRCTGDEHASNQDLFAPF